MLPDADLVEHLRRELFGPAYHGLIAAYRFGSTARGEERADSDVDLAFLAERSLDPTAVFDAAQSLAITLGRDVDLVDLRQASTVMRAEVVGRGARIFTGDADCTASFEMYAFSDYARLAEERAAAVAAFTSRYLPDDTGLNKTATLERCIARVRELFRDDPGQLDDQTVEDAIVLNLLRACEASIDLAMHAVARDRLGIPQGSRDAFALLGQAGVLPPELARRLQLMVGFRNVAVHDYQKISRPILLSILRERLGDFEAFCAALLAR